MKKSSAVIRDVRVVPLKRPLARPFRTALGQHDELDNFLVSLKLADGTRGFGEAAVAPHITGETVAKTEENLRAIGQELVGEDVADHLALSAFLHQCLPKNKCAVAALETAVVDALTRQWGIPLWRFFGARPARLSSDITVVISGLEETIATAKGFYRQGFRAFKVKIGRDMDLDHQRVLAVKKVAPGCAIYLDANQGYSAEQTLRFLKGVRRAGVRPELIEQPVPKEDWEGLKKVARLAGVPVCADESVSSLSDAVRAVRERAVQVINIKLMKTGIFHSREIAFLAKANGIKLMIGGMMESSLAMTASAHLAAGMGCFDFVDLDTPFFIKGESERNPCLSSRGTYDLSSVQRGIGIVPGRDRS